MTRPFKPNKQPTRKHKRRAASNETMGRYDQRMAMVPLAEPCPECGKKRYLTRKAAREAARRTDPGASLSVYRCGDSGYFHIGHTPYLIKHGYQARD